MRIFYPYNEHLPKKTAHDVYIFNNCYFLARHTQASITLLTGHKTLSTQNLLSYYGMKTFDHFDTKFKLEKIPHLRKSRCLHISYNRLFFWLCQRFLKKQKKSICISSVIKQGAYHVSRKLPHVLYVYELHGLHTYPNTPVNNSEKKKIALEIATLKDMDLITVTTDQLRKLLLTPPYNIKTPIEVIPLAVKALPLVPTSLSKNQPLNLFYVGQLYHNQGLSFLINSLKYVKYPIHLHIIGGKPKEIEHLRKKAPPLDKKYTLSFDGFVAPNKLANKLATAHAFIAPFLNHYQMPYVAHTKLLEYFMWKRPIIAPNLPVVREHFEKDAELFLYKPDNSLSLAQSIDSLNNIDTWKKASQSIYKNKQSFDWKNRCHNYFDCLQDFSKSHKF